MPEGEAGIAVQEVCRQHRIGDHTDPGLPGSKSGGREVTEARRVRPWEEENWRLQQRVAEHARARARKLARC